ncbi:unnamed protein product [Phytophthora fragariaefolia]|uniref:Unnamed protein product n=1 Tax=Phytophthora fragariaefolia TaxID=1490495 RepID=A0A9W6Y635_9STRA|nr:unnamed protein product [Phytophthora fragariaefolia]
MIKGTTSLSGLSPATARGFLRARINSVNSVDSTDSTTTAAMNATADKSRSVQFDDDTTRGHRSDEDDEGEDEEEKDEFGDVKTTAELLGDVEELSPQVSQMGRPLPVWRNLAAELEDDADDDDDDEQGVAPGTVRPLIPIATRNADTASTNRVLARLGEEMRSESERIVMIAPVAMTQAKWSVLGPELTQPVNSTDINQLVEDTVLLLKAMGFRCNGRPNSLILDDWSLSRAGAELLKWKRRLRLAFGLERHVGSRQMIARRTIEFPGLESDPSRVPLPKTLATKKDKKALKGRSARYAEFYDAADEAELGGGDSDDDRDYRDNAEDSAKDVIRRLSLDDAERDRGHYLEVRSHASLVKIAEFEDDRRGDRRDFRVTVTATSDDEEGDGVEYQPSRGLGQRDYDDKESYYGREALPDSEGEPDHDYIDTGLANGNSRSGNARKDPTRIQRKSTRTQWSSARPQGSSTGQWSSANQLADTVSRAGRFTDRRGNYGPLRTTGQLCHRECRQIQVARRSPGSLHAEQFKLGGPPTLTGLDKTGLPQSAEPVAGAKYIFTYVGEAGRPERVRTDGNDGREMDGIDGELDYLREESRAMISNVGATRLGKGAKGMAKTM